MTWVFRTIETSIAVQTGQSIKGGLGQTGTASDAAPRSGSAEATGVKMIHG
jgi:hypothetical protein